MLVRLAPLFLLTFSAQGAVSVADKLEEIYRQYRSVEKGSPGTRIKLLITLDQSLRTLVDKPWTIANKSIDIKYWKAKYQGIGVGVRHYSDALGYSGKLLAEARALDEHSTFASYTHYAEICDGLGSSAGGCRVPNVEAALRYEKDFPNGPFIEDTLITLGSFYDDLYKALNETRQGYKYECFSKYVKQNEPLSPQRQLAQRLALRYFTKVLALGSENHASNKAIQEWKRNLEDGKSAGWHLCGD